MRIHASTLSFHTNQVLSEQIRRLLKSKPKTKLLSLDSGTTPEAILANLDQFYSDIGAMVGDEILSKAYSMKQKDDKNVAEYASCLDNPVQKARTHGPNSCLMNKWLTSSFTFSSGRIEGLRD